MRFGSRSEYGYRPQARRGDFKLCRSPRAAADLRPDGRRGAAAQCIVDFRGFVERELRAYLACGVLAHGFLRVHCDACGHDRLVAFSCKGRGFCPSCGGRRMAGTAAHLVERVLPEVPVRQWVLTLPYPLRYRCAWDARLTSEVLRAFLRAGHPVGATGVRQLLDCYLQVTGTAGDFQVDGAKNFQTLNIGGSGTTSVSFIVGV